MKKLFIVCFTFLGLCALGYGQSVYNFSITNLDGGAINLNSFQGKKIIVVTYNASSPSVNDLHQADSIYRTDSNRVAVIAVGISDQGSLSDSTLQRILRNDLEISCLLGKPVIGNKNNPAQHPLLKWLTHSSLNGHYNVNITEGGQLFIINEQGGLFGTFRRNTPALVLNRALNSSQSQ